jgi:hypothetical protein
MWGHHLGSYLAITNEGSRAKAGSMTTDDRTKGASLPRPSAAATSPEYVIRVKGHLDPRWATWFDGLRLSDESDGTTLIEGPVVDQAALHGLIQKLRDVGIPLISLTQTKGD